MASASTDPLTQPERDEIQGRRAHAVGDKIMVRAEPCNSAGLTAGSYEGIIVEIFVYDNAKMAKVQIGTDVLHMCIAERKNKRLPWSMPVSKWSATNATQGAYPVRRPSASDAAKDARIAELSEALTDMVTMYVEMVESGDCGNWDAEDVDAVKAARAALGGIR